MASTQRCPHCDNDIPAQNFTLHQVHCDKHLKKCPKCLEMFPRSTFDEHIETHRMVECPKCGEQVDEHQLDEHTRTQCIYMDVKCDYCELNFPLFQHEEHVDYCSSRTEECPRCNLYIKLRDWDVHMVEEMEREDLRDPSSPYRRSKDAEPIRVRTSDDLPLHESSEPPNASPSWSFVYPLATAVAVGLLVYTRSLMRRR